MKGQPIMKHARDLIGASVHVYSRNFNSRPDLPRHGIVSGFGSDEGMFNITVTHNYSDMFNGLPPFGFLDRCLVIDDPDDLPIGINDYAILINAVDNSSSTRRTSEAFRKVSGDAPESPLAAKPDEYNSDSDDDTVDLDSEDVEIEHDPDDQFSDQPDDQPSRPVGETPVQRLVSSDDWQKQIMSIAGVAPMTISGKEMVLMIEDDDKPIARIVYIPPKAAPNEPQTDPYGFTIKLRDRNGRCTKMLDSNINHPDIMKRTLSTLSKAIRLAMTAERGDFASAASNMDAAVNAFRK